MSAEDQSIPPVLDAEVAEGQRIPLLELREVQRVFRGPEGGEVPVLQGVSLQIFPGESVSIRGESGSGKTTLLHIMTGLEPADGGQVLWRGVEVGRQTRAWRAQHHREFFGIVFQSCWLVPELTALENVLLPLRMERRGLDREGQARAEELLEAVGLGHRRDHRPAQLSGGERQRVALARALIHRPQVVLADEPTGNLDERTAEVVMDLLLGLCRREGTSLVLVTHHPGFAERADRQLVMRHGKVITDGTERTP